LLALCIFLIVKSINKAKDKLKKEEESKADEAVKPDDIVLLEEIRDLLKNK
jgi:large conductance mechanosensitive channel